MATAIASIGHNAPPPLEAHRLHIEELMENARQFLDGEPITTQGQADAVGKLLAMLREARKGAEDARTAEKAPHLEAGRAVDAAWKPLTESVATAEGIAKKALAPFLVAEQARKDAEAAEARRIAAEAAERARKEIEDANAGADLAARERAEETVKAADAAAKEAAKLEGSRAKVAGGPRAVSLRSVWTATLVEPVEALKHYRATQPDALKAWLSDQADADVRAGSRSIPGFSITEDKVAV